MSTYRKYDYQWCAEVVQELFERYSRGAYFLAKMWDCPFDSVRKSYIRTLASGSSVAWEAKKKVLKLCDRESFSEYRHVPVAERRKYLTLVKYNAEGWAISKLDQAENDQSTLDVWIDGF